MAPSPSSARDYSWTSDFTEGFESDSVDDFESDSAVPEVTPDVIAAAILTGVVSCALVCCFLYSS